jgi:hypothetical protein
MNDELNSNSKLADLCLEHLHKEEAMLKTALSIVGAIKNAFGERGLDVFATVLGRHRELTGMIADIQRRRRQFAEAAARQIGVPCEKITMSVALARLPSPARAAVAETASRVRGLAQELAAANFVVSVHVRVHLDAYRRILRDLTNTTAGSGRYCPAGNAEAVEYRPMMQISS